MRVLGENKSKVWIFTCGRHGQIAEILKEILRHIKIQRFMKYGLGGERLTSLGKLDQARVLWRIDNVLYTFIVASVCSLVDVVTIEVDVLKLLGASTRGNWRYGGETDPFANGTDFVRGLHLIAVKGSCCGAGGNDKSYTAKARGQWGTREHGTDRISDISMGTLDGSIIMGRVVSYRPCLSKQVKDFLAATNFPFKIHPNTFGIDRRSGALCGKPFGEPVDGRSLGAKYSVVKLKWSRKRT
jgi:hypothetical protein